MKQYLWLIFAAAGLLLWGAVHLWELILGPVTFWLYLGLMGLSLLLLLTGVIWGLARVFRRPKALPPQG